MPQLDPNAPQPGDPLIFDRWTGLKNVLHPERLSPGDLVRARNVTLDDAGQISRRRGFTLKTAGNAHSLFTASTGQTLGVLNGSLGLINGDYSFTSLGATITSDPSQGFSGLAYAQLGSKVYFTGTNDAGIVDLQAVAVGAWGSQEDYWLSPVVNPTATLPPVAGRLLRGPPPRATLLTYYRGRLLLGVDNILWATAPWLYNFVDVNAGFKQLESKITLLGAVGDGVYVGTDEGLYFLSGEDYPRWKKDRVMDSPVIPGSMVFIPGELGNPPQVPPGADTPLEVSLMFMTANGVCVASNSGRTVNITESKYFFPQATSAVSMYRRQDGMNQFITTLQSGGQPVSNAAIGDYIDVTIIRASQPAPPQRVGVVIPTTNSLSSGVVSTDALTYNYLPVLTPADRVEEDDATSRFTEDGNQRITETH